MAAKHRDWLIKKRRYEIDFKKTGLGDAWMRFMALATLSRIRPAERHVVYPPEVLVPLARRMFEGFFDIEVSGPADIEMSHLGLRHLLPGMLRGKRYYSPFYWVLRSTRVGKTFKDRLNDIGFSLAASTARLSFPSRKFIDKYQGFMELQGLKPFRDVSAKEFLGEAQTDFDVIGRRARNLFGRNAARNRIVVFPSGSAHQIMPPDVAARILRNADFAFYEKDELAAGFEQAGLNVIRFGKPPEQICELIASASAVFCTDSFPSHLAQMWPDRTIPMLTIAKAGATVHPSFPISRVVTSRAECHPCTNLARTGPDHRCPAGRVFCVTWESAAYLDEIANASPELASGCSIGKEALDES